MHIHIIIEEQKERSNDLEGGHTYIYLIYGMYYNLNIVASIKDDPQAVLIRAVEPLDFVEETLSTNGPGKLCRKLRIDKTYYGIDLCSSDIMYICDEGFNDFEVIESKRINIPYAEEYQDKLWRFYIKNNKYVSRK